MSLHPRIIEIIDPRLGLSSGNRIFTSLEGENPGGSMKDHMVWGELEALRHRGFARGTGIAEVSAGSTAASLAHYCPQFGFRCVLFVPTGISEDILVRLKGKGAEVVQEDLKCIYEKFDVYMKAHPELMAFDQLYDSSKRRHYHSFGKTICQQLGSVQAVIGGVGTGHSLLGIGEGTKASLVISAEPVMPLKISGIRNIEVDRYGPKDKISPEDFSQRMLIPQPLHFSQGVKTSLGTIEVGPSFALVLTAAREYLRGKTHQKIFVIGASSKLLASVPLSKVA